MYCMHYFVLIHCWVRVKHITFSIYLLTLDLMDCPLSNIWSPDPKPETISNETETLNILMCLWGTCCHRWFIRGFFRLNGHSVISLSQSEVATRLLRLLKTVFAQLPLSCSLQVSKLSYSGQKWYVYFLFLHIANVRSKIEFDALQQDGNLAE